MPRSTSAKFAGATGWCPAVALGDGLTRTIDYYDRHWRKYVE